VLESPTVPIAIWTLIEEHPGKRLVLLAVTEDGAADAVANRFNELANLSFVLSSRIG